MSEKNLDNLLAKLIDKRPDWEDIKGKYIILWNTRIYVINGALVAITLVLLALICWSINPPNLSYIERKFYQVLNNFDKTD